jgi:hypothetical protein
MARETVPRDVFDFRMDDKRLGNKARFEILTFLWNTTPCGFVNKYQHF